MAIVLQDSGLASGINTLAEILGQRKQQNLQRQQKNALSQVLSNADFSNQQGIAKFSRDYLSAGGEAKDIPQILKYSRPSALDRILGMRPTQEMGVPADGVLGINEARSSVDIDPSIPDRGRDSVVPTNPAIQGTPYSQIPDDMVLALSSSSNPEEAAFGKGLMELRKAAQKQYNEDRKFYSAKNKKFHDQIASKRGSIQKQKLALEEMKQGFLTRNPSEINRDWIASMFGSIGERFLTPEGALSLSAVKQYLIDDLASFTGQKNVFLERQILASLPSLGKDPTANEVILNALQTRSALDEASLDIYDKLLSQDVSEKDLVKKYTENMRAVENEVLKDSSYKIQKAKENYTSQSDYPSFMEKKVTDGTPLTLTGFIYFVKKYGKKEGLEKAREFGYRTLSPDEYRRLDNWQSQE